MKHLLYTLLIGLVIISCNKDEEYGSAPLALDVEHTVDLTERFNAFNDLIAGATFKAPGVSTQKGGDNGENWLELAWFESENEGYVYLRPENLGNGCYDDIHADISNPRVETYTLIAATGSDPLKINIQLGDATGQSFNVPTTLASRYTGAFASEASAIFFADYDTNWSVRFGSIPSVNVND